MKRLNFIPVLLVFIAINIKGQDQKPFEQGYLFFGGSLSGYAVKAELTTSIPNSSSFYSNDLFLNSNLHLGFFPTNYFAAGMKAEISLDRSKDRSGSISYVNHLLITPFIRLYTPIGLFAEGSFGFGSFKLGVSHANQDATRDIKKLNLGVGYSILIAEFVSIEPVISYELRKEFRVDDPIIKKYSGLNAHIGISIYLDMINREP